MTAHLRLANHITLTGDGELIIDGQPLGYHLAANPITAEIDPSGIAQVTITILAQGFDFDPETRRSQ